MSKAAHTGRKVSCAIAVLLAATALAIASSADASQIVFSQDPVDHAVSQISDWSEDYQKCDDFVLTGDSLTVTGIYWWGSYGADPDPAVDNFVFKFFTEDPFQPGRPYQLGYTDSTRFPKDYSAANYYREATSMVSDPSPDHDGGMVYAYWAVLDQPITFEAGERYWLAVTNKTPTWAYPSLPNSKWGWLGSAAGTHWRRLGHCPNCAQEWCASDTTNLAFRLDAVPIPEPGSLLVLFSSMAFSGGLMLRKRLFRRG